MHLNRTLLTAASTLALAASVSLAAPFTRVLEPTGPNAMAGSTGQFRSFLEGPDGTLYAAGIFSLVTNDGTGNVTNNSLVMQSTDGGNSWEQSLTGNGVASAFYALAASDSTVVGVGGTNFGVSVTLPGVTAALSGSAWDHVQLEVPEGFNDYTGVTVAYGNGLFIYGADKGILLKSTDGLNWTRVNWEKDGELGSDVSSVIFDGNRFVALVGGAVYASDANAANWTFQSLIVTPVPLPTKLTYLNGKYFVSGGKLTGQGAVASSSDLTNWTDSTTTIAQPVTGIAYGNGYYVAVTSKFFGSSLLYYSTDGIAWTELDAGIADCTLSAVAYLENDWFIAAQAKGSFFNPGIYKATDEFPPQSGTGGEPTGPWDNAFPVGPNVYFDVNLGFFYYDGATLWAFNYLLGWLYPVGDYNPDMWVYCPLLNDWMYVNQFFGGFTFRAGESRWYYYDSALDFFFPGTQL